MDINNLDNMLKEEDISMQSPDFRKVFNKIREQLLQNKNNYDKKHKVQVSSQNSMHGIVPALVVAASKSTSIRYRTYKVGTFFVGSELLEHRLKYLSQQHTDHEVVFDFNSMVVGNDFGNRYST